MHEALSFISVVSLNEYLQLLLSHLISTHSRDGLLNRPYGPGGQGSDATAFVCNKVTIKLKKCETHIRKNILVN